MGLSQLPSALNWTKMVKRQVALPSGPGARQPRCWWRRERVLEDAALKALGKLLWCRLCDGLGGQSKKLPVAS